MFIEQKNLYISLLIEHEIIRITYPVFGVNRTQNFHV